MSQASTQLRNRLDPEESLVAEYAATYGEDYKRRPGSIGITDRRLLCVSERDEVVTIGHDSICAIRSTPREMRTYRGNDYRLVLGGGGLVTVLGLVGIAVLSTSLLAPILSFLTVGALVTAAYLRRSPHTVEEDILSPLRKGADSVFGRNGLRRGREFVTDRADEQRVLVAGGGIVAALSFAGTVAVASSVFVPAAVVLLVGGIALMDYAHRHREELDGIEIVRQRKNDVTIRTVDGGTIHLSCDPSDRIDGELSKLVFTNGSKPDLDISPLP